MKRKATTLAILVVVLISTVMALSQVSRWKHTHSTWDNVGAILSNQDITVLAPTSTNTVKILLDADTGNIYASGSVVFSSGTAYTSISASTSTFSYVSAATGVFSYVWASNAEFASAAVVHTFAADDIIAYDDITANGNFIGDGSLLTNLPLSATPTLDSVLSAGNTTTQAFTAASATFTGAPAFTNAGAAVPFTVSSATALYVANLDADKLDGNHSTAFPLLASANTFTNTNAFTALLSPNAGITTLTPTLATWKLGTLTTNNTTLTKATTNNALLITDTLSAPSSMGRAVTMGGGEYASGSNVDPAVATGSWAFSIRYKASTSVVQFFIGGFKTSGTTYTLGFTIEPTYLGMYGVANDGVTLSDKYINTVFKSDGLYHTVSGSFNTTTSAFTLWIDGVTQTPLISDTSPIPTVAPDGGYFIKQTGSGVINIDDIRFYNTVLTQTQVDNINYLGAGSQTAELTGLIAHYLCDEEDGVTGLLDATNSNTLTLSNGSKVGESVGSSAATITILEHNNSGISGETGIGKFGGASDDTWLQGKQLRLKSNTILTSADPAVRALTITGAAAQASNTFEVQDSGGNALTYTEADGTLVFASSATVWEDLRIAGSSAVPDGSAGASLRNFNGAIVQAYAFQHNVASDTMYFQVQLPHGYKLGTDLYPHLHWAPEADGDGTEQVTWSLNCQAASNAAVFVSSTQMWASSTIGVGDAWKNKISYFKCDNTYTGDWGAAGQIGCQANGQTYFEGSQLTSVSTMLLCRLQRAIAVDDYDNWAHLAEIDFHYEMDTIGSRTQTAK